MLLDDVESGIWAGVFCVEVERLARGNTTDQGTVAQVFKYSDTKIYTPNKIYDPNDEYDEEYFEFGLFMARREYKRINQRLNNGRIASVKEGKWVGNKTPYGYDRFKLQKEKGFSLAPNQEEAPIIQEIFRLSTKERLSRDGIEKRLDELGIRNREGNKFSKATISCMLRNPVYAGFIRWGRRKQVKSTTSGKITISRPVQQEYLLTHGLHEPLVDIETWDMEQEKQRQNAPKVTKRSNGLQNPLAGLVICKECGTVMQRRPYNKDYPDGLICQNSKCDNISSHLYIVEDKLLEVIAEWIQGYDLELTPDEQNEDNNIHIITENTLKALNAELRGYEDKFNRLCGFYEDGSYDRAMFLERSKMIKADIERTQAKIMELEIKLRALKGEENNTQNFVPQVKHILDIYYSCDTEQRNKLLKTILEKVEYLKLERARKKTDPLDNFTLDIYPKLTKILKK